MEIWTRMILAGSSKACKMRCGSMVCSTKCIQGGFLAYLGRVEVEGGWRWFGGTSHDCLATKLHTPTISLG